jgi:hypothetical protein
MITKPQLPPKAGYVEVEVDGVRTYKNARTGVLIGDEPPFDDITLTKLAIAELAEAQEVAQTANELALAELAEIITGGE